MTIISRFCATRDLTLQKPHRPEQLSQAAELNFPTSHLTVEQILRIEAIAVEKALAIVDDGIARLIPAIVDDIQIRRFEDVLAMEYPEVPFA